MDNIEEFIIACEGLMIDEHDIVVEGVVAAAILSPWVLAGGMITIAMIYQKIAESKDNKKLMNRSPMIISQYIKDAKEIELMASSIKAMDLYINNAQRFFVRGNKLYNEIIILYKKYQDKLPTETKKKIRDDIDMLVNDLKKFEKQIASIVDTKSEIITDITYKTKIVKLVKVHSDCYKNTDDDDSWEDAYDRIGITHNEDISEAFENEVNNAIVHALKPFDYLNRIGNMILKTIKIRVK